MDPRERLRTPTIRSAARRRPAPASEARGFVPEFLRKVAVAGLGAVFMTEEGVRNLAGQLKLPKEVLGFILAQAEKTKDDVGRVVSEELRRFLQSEKLRDEFAQAPVRHDGGSTAQIRLVPGHEDEKCRRGVLARQATWRSPRISPLAEPRRRRTSAWWASPRAPGAPIPCAWLRAAAAALAVRAVVRQEHAGAWRELPWRLEGPGWRTPRFSSR